MSSFNFLALVLGWTLVIIVGLLGLVIVYKVLTNSIDISLLISESDGGGASLSRFQFLIFTFVIALSLFYVIVRQEGFPEEIPNGILALLGISGGSYVVSKGIQAQMDAPAPSKSGGGSNGGGGKAGGGNAG